MHKIACPSEHLTDTSSRKINLSINDNMELRMKSKTFMSSPKKMNISKLESQKIMDLRYILVF